MNYCQWTLYDESYGWRTSREWKLKPKCSWCPRVSGLGALFNLRLASISIAISPPNTGSYKVALERLRPMVHAFLRLRTNNNLMSLEVYLPSLNEKYWPLLFEISEPITRLRTRCRLLILAPSPELQNAFVAFLEKRKQPQMGMMTIVYCRDAGADAERHYSYYQLN